MQRRYLEAIDGADVVFGVGPAGTGKTYLAMAQAVSYLLAKRVSRIILARPAVEAGEKLGFLPGDLQEKVNPYSAPALRCPVRHARRRAGRAADRAGTIEVAPLAFMRGRTLNEAFVILDEAQNTTSEQMKMFLTRLGFGSKAVVTGDVTQIDLPTGKTSGLVEALKVVSGIEAIATVFFDERDVVRHSIVQQIVKAYEAYGAKTKPTHDRVRRRITTSAPTNCGGRVGCFGQRHNPRATCQVGRAARSLARARRAASGARHSRCGARQRRRDARLALRYRRTRHATDVLSFPAGPAVAPNPQGDRQLGDIAIALGVARRQAARHGHSLGMELRILALHGLLHLLGYDHERDHGEMRALEDRLRRRWGLSAGVVARASGSRTSR
jgi:rRNA maturation RNase YbeY